MGLRAQSSDSPGNISFRLQIAPDRYSDGRDARLSGMEHLPAQMADSVLRGMVRDRAGPTFTFARSHRWFLSDYSFDRSGYVGRLGHCARMESGLAGKGGGSLIALDISLCINSGGSIRCCFLLRA